MNYRISDTDLIVIEEVKKITKEDFKPKENNFVIKWLKENMLRLTTFLMLSAIIIKIVFDNIFVILVLLGIYFILVVIIIINGKTEHKYNMNFYFKELEKRKIKITDKAIFESFLYRFVSYKIYKESFNLNATSKYYLKKEKTNELTEEEIFISVIVFPEKYDLEKEDLGDGGDD